MFKLDGKVALVTGASGGIGAAIAQTLYNQGAKIVLSGTRQQVLEEQAAALGPNAFAQAADLSDPAAADALIAAAESLAGPLDILVNNAGFTRDTLSIRMKDEDWQSVLDVDLSAPFRLSRAALRGMLRRRSGRIISIGSIVGTIGNPGQANYCAAKAGLAAMSKSLAQEVGSRGITVNLVIPGFIETAMTHGLTDAQKERWISGIPLGRMGKPEEVAAAVAYFASNEAGWVTGASLHVNGGMAMI